MGRTIGKSAIEVMRKQFPKEASGIETYGDAFDVLAEKVKQGGGGSLPDPLNVGNVLTSTGDGWESAPPQGARDFIVSGTLYLTDGIPSGVAQLNHSLNEVLGALKSDREVTLIASTPGSVDKVILALPCVFGAEDGNTAVFSGTGYDGYSDVNLHVTVIYTQDDATLLVDYMPRVSSRDNGKILGVEDGALALIPPSALPNAPLIVHGTISGGVFEYSDTKVEDIYEARASGYRVVYLDVSEAGNLLYRYELTGVTHDDVGGGYYNSWSCLKHGVTKIIASVIGIGGAAGTTTGGSMIESDLTPNA